MSLPGDALPNTVAPVELQAPDEAGRPTRLVDFERGGIGLSDPSQGLLVQDWRIRLDGNDVKIGPAPYDVETTLFSEPGITQLSLTFDQSMRPAVAYMSNALAKLRWFDPQPNAVVTTTLDPDVRTPFLTMDDKRPAATTSGTNDILLFYARANRLCYRQQRERFQTERTLAWFDGTQISINKVGMNRGLRMQVEMVGLTNTVTTGAVLSTWNSAVYLASVTTLTTPMPGNIATGDLLFAAVMHRHALTIPTGWTLQTSVQCQAAGVVQTLSLLRKTTAALGDSGANLILTQASASRLGAAFFAVRATSGTPVLIASATAQVNDLATNTINAAAITASGTELIVAVATTINAPAAVTQPTAAAGFSVISGRASQTRLGVAYQRRQTGQASAPRLVFDNGTPANNGLAALTLRFGTA